MANMYPSKLASGSSAIKLPLLSAFVSGSGENTSSTYVENNNYSEVTVGTVNGSIKVAFYNATSQISSYTMQSNRTYAIPDGTVTIRFILSPSSYGACNASNVVIS